MANEIQLHSLHWDDVHLSEWNTMIIEHEVFPIGTYLWRAIV